MYTNEQLADLLQGAGIRSPFSTDYEAASKWREAHPGEAVNYDAHRETDRLGLSAAELPADWMLAVHEILAQRSLAAMVSKANAAFEALPSPVREAAQARRRQAHQKPEARDLSGLKPVRKYQPKAGCSLRLKLKEAVMFDYEQASYADHSRYVIPVEGDGPVDVLTCQHNLNDFCRAIRTATGFAGEGCNWTMELVEAGDKFVVVADCRASIGD